MKKILIPLFIVLFVFPLISAINISIEKQSENEVLVADLGKPAVFDLKITNHGSNDNFEFYNLLGFTMFPVGTVNIGSGQTKIVQLGMTPIGKFNYRGLYTFEYFIRGSDDTEVKERLTFRAIDLEEAFEVGSGELDPESNSLEIYIYNKVNFDFGEMSAKFSSSFFKVEKEFSLGPNERENFNVTLNKDDFKALMAGFYTLKADVSAQGESADVEGIIKFVEKDILTTTKKDYGLIIYTQIVEKVNEGNVLVKSETVIKKNIISRLFTSFSPEPDSVDRSGFKVYYTWAREIKPSETLEISVRTNWLFPLLIIFFIVAIVLLAKQYSRTHLSLRKKISFVKAKGGEFALKVSIFAHAKKYVERVSIIDRLPPLVKIYEKFGREEPTRVDEKTRRIEWNFEKLEAGEIRILSYIIYSKIGVLGKFALPSATAVYEKGGEIHETESNKAFFVTEQREKDEGD